MLYIYTNSEAFCSLDDIKADNADFYFTHFRKVSDSKFEFSAKVMKADAPGYSHVVDVEELEAGRPHTLFIPTKHAASVLSGAQEYPDILTLKNHTTDKLDFSERIHNDITNVIRLYRVPDTNDCIVLITTGALFEGVTREELRPIGKNDIFTLIAQHDPLYRQSILEPLRTKLVLDLDANDSLAYIDAQLDFVTRMLFRVVESLPEVKLEVLKDIKQYSNFKDACERSDLYSIKNEMQGVEELRNNKAAVRELQRAYYAAKAALEEKDGDQ
ncbi:hypothetical protein V6C53_16220 [Desulfocurvibacter africanus]|uniref:hypothetical protein n=1 Tax=Desulfocurvibacter africanus TaxID=873 RepID=UPI002FDAAED2